MAEVAKAGVEGQDVTVSIGPVKFKPHVVKARLSRVEAALQREDHPNRERLLEDKRKLAGLLELAGVK